MMEEAVQLNQVTIMVIALLGLTTFVIPLKYFLLPFILTATLIPVDQRIIISGLDFTVLRILVVIGVMRLGMRGELRKIQWNRFDTFVLAWVITGAFIYSVQWLTMAAIINRSGVIFDVLGLYFIFRQRLVSFEDIKLTFKMLAVSVFILAPLVALEWAMGENPFVVLGRVETAFREERYRCQAAFPHSIMLGLFWATLVPMFIGLGRLEKNTIYWAAVGASVFIIFATASSTPLATLIVVLGLLAVYKYRIYTKATVVCSVIVLSILHVVMNKPVWHLVSRINMVGGSTGWHRYHLIDKAVANFPQWFLLGTRDTASWGQNLGDVTNQYILEGVRGGFVTLVLFVAVLFVAVKTLTRFSLSPIREDNKFMIWSINVAILGHILSFTAVSYFGQINMLLYMMLAIVGLVYGHAYSQSVPVYKENYGRLSYSS